MAGAFVQSEVRAARFREELNRTQDALRKGLTFGRSGNISGLEQALPALEARQRHLQSQIERIEASERELLRKQLERAGQFEDITPQSALDAREAASTTSGRSQAFEAEIQSILGVNEAYQTYESQLFQVSKAIEVLTKKQKELSEAAETAASTQVDAAATAFANLRAVSTGTDAQIAEALQKFENVMSGEDASVRDLGLDIGAQLVGVSRSDNVRELKSRHEAIHDLLISNSLLIKDSEELSALAASANAAVQAKVGELVDAVPVGASDRTDQLRELALFAGEVGAVEAEASAKRGLLAAAETARLGAEVKEREEIANDFNTFQTRISKIQGLDQINRYNQDVKAFKESLIQKGFALEEFAHIFESLHSQMLAKGAIIGAELRAKANEQVVDRLSDADANLYDQKFDRGFKALSELPKIKELKALRERFQELEDAGQFNLGPGLEGAEGGGGLLKINRALRAVYSQRESELIDAAYQKRDAQVSKNEQASYLHERDLLHQIETAKTEDQVNAIITRFNKSESVEASLIRRNTNRYLTLLKAGIARIRALEQEERDKGAQEEIDAAQQQVDRLKERALDAGSTRRIQIVQREVSQAIARYSELGESYSGIVQDLMQINQNLSRSFDEAFTTERLARFRDGVQNTLAELIGLGLDRFNITDSISDALRGDAQTIRFDAELGDFIFDDSTFLNVQTALDGVEISANNLTHAVDALGETPSTSSFTRRCGTEASSVKRGHR